MLGTVVTGGHLRARLPHFPPMLRLLVLKDSGMITLTYHIIYAFNFLICKYLQIGCANLHFISLPIFC